MLECNGCLDGDSRSVEKPHKLHNKGSHGSDYNRV